MCADVAAPPRLCAVVARVGIPELLDAHPSAEPVHLGVAVKFPDGWEANQVMMARLSQHRVARSRCKRGTYSLEKRKILSEIAENKR